MRLQKLIIKDFKGIRIFVLDAQGVNASIFADNALGKTTIADAYYWLLYDKDSQNKKDFSIKTLDSAGNVLNGLDHEVEGIFDIKGRHISFHKIYSEQWTKKRGSASATFTGNTTDYYIDGVPVKKNEYVARIKLIADEEIFKLLTSPTYFNEQLSWDKRRSILLEICGDISDEDVINSNKSLTGLPDILNGHALEDYRKIIASRRTKINDELKKIPVRIDEVTRSLPDLTGQSMAPIISAVADIQSQIKSKEQELSRIENGGQVTEKRNQIRKIEGELITLKNEIQGKISEQIDTKRRELQTVKELLFNSQSNVKNKNSTLEYNRKNIENLEKEMEGLRTKWVNADAKQFTFEQEDTCPTCGQSLPAEKLTEARAKALAAFNLAKANALETITAQGKECKGRVEAHQAAILTLNDEIKVSENKVSEYTKKSSGMELLIENMMKDADLYKEAPAYVAKLGEKQAVEEQIKQLQQDNSEAIAAVKKDIEQLGGTLLNLQTSLAKFDQKEKGQARIQELSDQERDLAAEYEKLEGELYLTEQFVRTKVNMLEEKINSKFKMARFKLFDTQVNGAVVECCETLYQGVPYSSGLNNAARINVGLDIINTLSEHYKFSAPIFIDNREAVTKLIDTKAQVISLVVSEPDKELRVEVDAGQCNLFKEAI